MRRQKGVGILMEDLLLQEGFARGMFRNGNRKKSLFEVKVATLNQPVTFARINRLICFSRLCYFFV